MLRQRMMDIMSHRHTLWEMARAELKAKYASSMLGIYLALISPCLIMGVITFVFTAILKIRMYHFPLFVLSGIMPWLFFSNSLFEATLSIVNQKNILRQFNIPREIIPLSIVVSHFINFMIGWAVLYPVFLFFNPKTILIFPLFILIMCLQLLAVAGIGMIFSVLNVFLRDISQLLSIFLMFLFWATPVFYTLEMVPLQFRWILALNPMLPFIRSYQMMLYSATVPSGSLFFAMAALAAGTLIAGLYCFAIFESRFLKYL